MGGRITSADSLMDDGVKGKITSIDAFTAFYSLEEHHSIQVTDLTTTKDIQLLKTQILTGISSINGGVNINYLSHIKYKGLSPSLYDVVQEMGHVDLSLLAEPGSNTYKIHISFDSYISLYIRIMRGNNSAKRI